MKRNCKIIAEIAQAHDGSLGILHSYIDAAADCGVDAVKFQTHIAEAESSEYEPFRVKFSYEDKTRYDYWKRMELSKSQWYEIKKHCEKRGLEFISSPFSNAAVDLLEDVGVDTYKIGSGEVSNLLLLEKIAKTGKEVIISSGMSNFKEIDIAIDAFSSFNNKLGLVQCTSSYPVSPRDIGINVISLLREKYGHFAKIGFSDHSGDIYAALSAAAVGIDYYEGHITFNKKIFGPDTSSSLDLEQFSKVVSGIRYIEDINSNPVDKNDLSSFSKMKEIFEKSLCVNKKITKGHVLTFDDLEAKKPSGLGISAKNYKNIVGKEATQDLEKWDFITDELVK